MSKRKKYPIRMSIWYVEDIKTKQRFTVDEVLVCGERKHLKIISETRHYLFKIYKKIYSKTSFKKNMDEKRLKVLRIKIKEDLEFGTGVGCFEEGILEKHGLE